MAKVNILFEMRRNIVAKKARKSQKLVKFKKSTFCNVDYKNLKTNYL